MKLVAVTRPTPGPIQVEDAVVRVLDRGASRADLLSFVHGAHVIISMFSNRVDAELLDAAGPQLRGVCNHAVGVDNIDVDLCRSRGITVTNTPDTVTEGTANLALMLMLAVARRLTEAQRFARTGDWHRHGPLGMDEFLGLDLCGRTLLIVGAGRIGYALACRARVLGMRIAYVARTAHADFEISPLAAQRVGLDDGLAEADVVSFHTPLTPETRHLLSARRIALLKPTAIVINTARGPVIDEAALAEALAAKRIWGAGLDVFEHEPAIHPGLATLDNTVLTPHIGSAERRWRRAMSAQCAASASAILHDLPVPHRVV